MQKKEGQKNFGPKKRLLLNRKLSKQIELVFLQQWVDGLALDLAQRTTGTRELFEGG